MPPQTWQYPLIDANEDKRYARVGTPVGKAHECIGFDGTEDGGLRPFPGFIRVHSLSKPVGDGRISWFRAFQIRVADTKFAYGFVYRTTKTGLDNIYIEWRTDAVTTFTRTTLAQNISATLQCDLAVVGRLLYVYIQGRPCVRFYIDETAPSTFVARVLGGPSATDYPGPGRRPFLFDADKVISVNPASWTTLAHTESGVTRKRPARGGVHLLATGPDSIASIPLVSGGWGSGVWPSGGAGSVGSGGINDPDGTWGDGTNPQKNNDVRQLAPGDYAFAYQLIDSKTGLKSSLSEVAVATYNTFVTGSGSGAVANYRYAALSFVFDSTKWDKAVIYRSVRIQDAGGVLSAATLWKENTITLADYLYGRQGNDPNAQFTTADESGNIITTTDARRVLYFYEADDKQLVNSDAFLDERTTFDEFPPTGGSCYAQEQTLFVSSVRRWASDTGVLNPAIGETRWSSPFDGQPELFQQVNIFTPPQISSEVIRFVGANGNIVGLCRDRLFMFRKESVYVKAQEMQKGFGLVNPNAVAEVGGTVYYLNSKGILTVDTDGRLDSVDSVNSIINREWTSLATVHMAFDPYISALFVVNPYPSQNENTEDPPVNSRAIVFWFRTSKVRELYDTAFLATCNGLWNTDPTSNTGDLTERAFFLDGYGNVFVVDARRQKSRLTLLDPDGTVRFDLVQANSVDVQVSGGTINTPSTYLGCTLYVLTGPNRGQSSIIQGCTNTGGALVFTPADVTPFLDLPAGTRLGVSPVYCRWTGAHLLKYAPDGTPIPYDFFQRRIINTLGCSFADVSGAAAGLTEASFRALAWAGNASEISAWATPRDTTGTEVPAVSESEGNHYAGFDTDDTASGPRTGFSAAALFPSVEIACPELDFRLLAVRVTGTINKEVTSTDINA